MALFKIDVHVVDGRANSVTVAKLDTFIASLALLHRKVDTLMALVDDLKAGIAALDAETTKVAARIDALIARLGSNTLTDAEKAEVFSALAAETARLKTLGTDTVVPVPPEPPALTTARKK